MPKLVRERHQRHPAQSRLHVLFGRILGATGKYFFELRLENGERIGNRNFQTLDAKIRGESECIQNAAA